MVARTLQKLTSQSLYLAKEASGYAPWAAPGAILAGWMVWPGLTQSFKEETLGLAPEHAPGSAAAVAAAPALFSAKGKYKYTRPDVGERPVLEEDDE